MQLIEVKNNLVRINYDTAVENLVLSGFVVIKDVTQSFISQIINLEASGKGNFAIAKLLFNFDDQGVVTKYNGSIPALNSVVDIVSPQELLELFPTDSPFIFGELAQQKAVLKLDGSIFKEKMLVCSEHQEDKDILTENIALQLIHNKNKVVVFDINGKFDSIPHRIKAGDNFRLPLNYDLINFIYGELEDASAETKATVQEVFLEVQNYVKTLPEGFIPFETFKNVVDAQYDELEIPELLLLKNKLLKYYEEGVFAQQKQEFELLKQLLLSNNALVIDLSEVDDKVQREFASYAYSVMQSLNEDIYVVFNVEDENSDKKLLKKIFTAEKLFSTIIAPYSYKYLKELKQLSKNMILFAPIQQQDDFAGYNVFLNKLNSQEFIVYGQKTQHIPFIVKLERLFESIPNPAVVEDLSRTEDIDEQIKQDVDSIYTASKSIDTKDNLVESEEQFDKEVLDDNELTDDDLDLIEDLALPDTDDIAVEEIDNIQTTFTADEIESSYIPQEEISFDDTLHEDIEPIEDLSEDFSDIAQEETFEQPLEAESFEDTTFGSEAVEESFSDVLNQEKLQQEQIIENAPVVDILPANMSSTPIVPVYPADIESQVESDKLNQGDVIVHPKYGKGTVEKLINYGAKTLCSINFDNVGRRLLDPNLAELKKVE